MKTFWTHVDEESRCECQIEEVCLHSVTQEPCRVKPLQSDLNDRACCINAFHQDFRIVPQILGAGTLKPCQQDN